MTNSIFHSQKFNFKGIDIPDFDLKLGGIVRLCIPNFDSKGNSLVHNFRYDLLNHFEKMIPDIKWSKEYSVTGFKKLLKPITVEDYIMRNLNVDITHSRIIAEYLKLDSNEKVKNLILGKQKALAIKCDFINYETLIFDYYGVGATEFNYLEKVVDNEISKRKCGIVIDRLEYNQKDETNKNITQIKVTMDNTIYSK